jgi:hypothetical protein
MFNSLMMLALEANGVVALRMMKLMRGGRRARREAKLMFSEKMDAAFEATAGRELLHFAGVRAHFEGVRANHNARRNALWIESGTSRLRGHRQ